MPAPAPPYVIDLHAHFPMQFDGEASVKTVREAIRRARQHHEHLSDRVRFAILEFADRFWNRPSTSGGHAVTLDTLVAGGVGVALSVAYYPFDEIDIHAGPGKPPADAYFQKLLDLLNVVEAKIHGDSRAKLVRNLDELKAARADGKLAMIHAVEGGFHVGESHEAIRKNVETLAKKGAGYVTVAHLLWRRLATNTAALPFLSDATYRILFPQDDVGLELIGVTLVTEMVKRGILVDLTHMSERGMDDAFHLLDRLDPGRHVPVIATHVACRMPNGYDYNFDESYLAKIAGRGGIAGVIYCDHFIRDHRGSPTKTFDESFSFLKTQIDKLRAIGGDEFVAIGSDLDGFIKPALAGLETAANHKDLAARLVGEYGQPFARKMCHENALRVFEKAWMKPVQVA